MLEQINTAEKVSLPTVIQSEDINDILREFDGILLDVEHEERTASDLATLSRNLAITGMASPRSQQSAPRQQQIYLQRSKR